LDYDEKPTIKDLIEIVKYFLFIKENKEKTKLYQRSKIQNFFENYKIIIKNFFHKKQMMEILDFLGKIYLDMLKLS
jgi:hypothetical protein